MLFLFLSYLNFCSDFFVHAGKWLDKKAKVNFKIYDITDWTANNCNTLQCTHYPISQEVKATRE